MSHGAGLAGTALGVRSRVTCVPDCDGICAAAAEEDSSGFESVERYGDFRAEFDPHGADFIIQVARKS